MFGVAINAIAVLGIYFIPESPEYLYCFYKFKECSDSVIYISKFNKQPISKDFLFTKEIDLQLVLSKQFADDCNNRMSTNAIRKLEFERSMLIQKSVKSSLREFFSVRSQAVNLLLSVFLWVFTILNYQVICNYPNYFPGDAYENAMTFSAIELLAYIVAAVLYGKLKAKKLFVLAYAISMVGSVGLLLSN